MWVRSEAAIDESFCLKRTLFRGGDIPLSALVLLSPAKYIASSPYPIAQNGAAPIQQKCSMLWPSVAILEIFLAHRSNSHIETATALSHFFIDIAFPKSSFMYKRAIVVPNSFCSRKRTCANALTLTLGPHISIAWCRSLLHHILTPPDLIHLLLGNGIATKQWTV